MFKLILGGILLWSVTGAADNLQYDNNRTVTIDCGADPYVTIAGDSNTITLKGTCKKVLVAGNSNTLTIASAALLEVDGNHTTVSITAVESIEVNGDHNTIGYKSKDPRIAIRGEDNTVDKK